MKVSDALMGQFEVVHALIIRETRTRYGAHKLGYLWALVEPALMLLTFYILFAVAGRKAPTGMTLFAFTATGVCPYLVFSNTASRVADSISANRALLFYPQVRVIDIVIARTFLELATYIAVFFVLIGAEAMYLQRLSIDDPLLTLLGFVLASLLGCGVGLLFCAGAQLSNSVDRARGPILRPMFWISGIFFTTAGLPASARDAALINPLLHAIELTRAGWFARYDDTYGSPLYILAWSISFLLAGLLLERIVRRKIELT